MSFTRSTHSTHTFCGIRSDAVTYNITHTHTKDKNTCARLLSTFACGCVQFESGPLAHLQADAIADLAAQARLAIAVVQAAIRLQDVLLLRMIDAAQAAQPMQFIESGAIDFQREPLHVARCGAGFAGRGRWAKAGRRGTPGGRARTGARHEGEAVSTVANAGLGLHECAAIAIIECNIGRLVRIASQPNGV